MPVAHIIRGMPGSGKTALAKSLNCNEVSADDFFTDEDGTYKFDPSKIGEAHQWCFGHFIDYLSLGLDISVHNTFTALWEFENYIKVAKLAGYTVEVHEMIIDNPEQIRKCTSRNIHGVPLEIMLRMWHDFVPYNGPETTTHHGIT